MQIFKGSSPLDYAMKHNKFEVDLINESKEFKTILEKCFKKDYKERPTASSLCNDPFFSKFVSE